jgi:AraC-like DNA-binding protein
MFDSIVSLFTFFSSGLALLMAFVQIILTERHVKNFLNFILLVTLGITLPQFLLIYVERTTHPILYFLHLTLVFSAGPASYLRQYTGLHEIDALTLREWAHFIPALLAFMLETAVQLFPSPLRVELINLMMKTFYHPENPFLLLRLLGYLHLIGYLTVYVVVLFKNFKFVELNIERRVAFYSIIHTFIAFAIIFISHFKNITIITKIGIMLLGSVSIYWYFISYKHPKFWYLVRQHGTAPKRYERSRIRGLNVVEIRRQLIKLMEEEKIFCDEDITLNRVADELAITPHQLSELLNAELKMSFKSLINLYRVEEAKKVLIREPDRTILSVAYAVGFNSRSNFNTVFLKLTGQPPTDYRK